MNERGKLIEAAGVIAVIYGAGTYMVLNLSWPEYLAWIAGGVVLLLVAWAKRSMDK